MQEQMFQENKKKSAGKKQQQDLSEHAKAYDELKQMERSVEQQRSQFITQYGAFLASSEFMDMEKKIKELKKKRKELDRQHAASEAQQFKQRLARQQNDEKQE
jgi:hypothetical protein